MPVYDYHCQICDNHQEEYHSINENPIIKCEKCGEKCEKYFTGSTNFVLKGDGWSSYNSRIKRDMTNRNKRMKRVMTDRTNSGEAVNSLEDLKNK